MSVAIPTAGRRSAMPTSSGEVEKRLRVLVEAEDLPAAPPRLTEPDTPGLPADPFMRVRTDTQAQCVICLERGPDVSYVYRDGHQIRVHATCHAVWREIGKLAA